MSLRTLAFAPHSLRRTLGAVALVVGCLTGTAASAGQIISLSTPAGLNPGDTFRFAFVTTGTIDAVSSDIDVYNSFVNTQAAGATYGGSTVSWKAIGSTVAVNARDNVGGFGTSVPVYLVDGTRVANSLTTGAGGFWSGSLLNSSFLSLSIDGTSLSNKKVWTGSLNNGLADSGFEIGPPEEDDDVTVGSTALSTNFLCFYGEQVIDTRNMFAMSSNLTVSSPAPVPEIDPAGMGSVLALVTGALG